MITFRTSSLLNAHMVCLCMCLSVLLFVVQLRVGRNQKALQLSSASLPPASLAASVGMFGRRAEILRLAAGMMTCSYWWLGVEIGTLSKKPTFCYSKFVLIIFLSKCIFLSINFDIL